MTQCYFCASLSIEILTFDLFFEESPLLDTQLEALTQRVRETLLAGRVVVIMGWRVNHHTPFTKSLPERKVRFYLNDRPPKSLSGTVGLVLYPEYLSHRDVERLKRGLNSRIVYPIVVHYRTIISTIESCKDLMVVQPCTCANPQCDETRAVTKAEPAVGAIPLIQDLSEDVLDFLTTPPLKEKHEMNKMECFAKAFLEAATSDGEGRVGKVTLGKLRTQCGVEESVSKLIRDGWLESVVTPGKQKAGWYKAGQTMLQSSADQKNVEPEDPYELAKFLVAQKPGVLAEFAEAEKKLARIELAEKVLEQLAGLKKSE